MHLVLRKVKGRWFFGDFCGRITSKDVFHCVEKSCPYSVKMKFTNEDGMKTPKSVEEVLCGFHCHAFPENKKYANKRIIQEERALIDSGNDPEGILARKHDDWQDDAREQSKRIADKLLGVEAAVEYACKNPHLSGRQVHDQYPQMKPHAIDMARLRQMKKQCDVTNLDDLIRKKNHHLLKNEEEEILIFGLKSAVGMMSRTKMILADGTFTCLLLGYSQLHVFHAVVKNNVSLPMLFCLVKGKDSETYAKLLQLVEELAVEKGTTIFNRPVTLMCDFEASFISTVKDLYASVEVKCCFFHFVKNMRTNASPVMTAIRRHGDGRRKHTSWRKGQSGAS